MKLIDIYNAVPEKTEEMHKAFGQAVAEKVLLDEHFASENGFTKKAYPEAWPYFIDTLMDKGTPTPSFMDLLAEKYPKKQVTMTDAKRTGELHPGTGRTLP